MEEVAATQNENLANTVGDGAANINEIPEKFEALQSVVSVLVNEENKEISSSNLENPEPKKVDKPTEIRLEIPLANRYNNVVYYPDLLKEAGISIVKTPPRYISGSESLGSDSPHSDWSDFETPDDFQPTSPPASNPPALFNDDSNGFFQKLMENAEKYDMDEQEKNRKKRRTRSNKKEQQYDVNDPFIDDSELVPLQRDFGKVRTEVEGFFVWQGPLTFERLVDEDEQPKKKAPAKRKPKSAENETPKVRKKRTVKKADANGNDANPKPNNPKKRVSKKALVNNEVKHESSLVSVSSSISNNTFHGDSTTIKNHPSAPGAIPNISTNNGSHTSANQKALLDASKTLGKKKRTYITESVHSEVQNLLDIFKELVEAESFEVKSKFPPNLKNPLMDILVKAYELEQFNENLFKILTNMLPYNKYTITRLCQRTLYPKTLVDIQRKKLELIEQLKIAVNEIMPSLMRDSNEKREVHAPESSVVPANAQGEAMEIDENDGEADVEHDADADVKSDSRSDSSTNNRPRDSTGKKFRWDDTTRRLLWRIVQEEMSWVSMSNDLNEAEEKSERHSEQTCRKSLYQELLKVWPSGWMTSYEIARVYSAYKRYLRDRQISS